MAAPAGVSLAAVGRLFALPSLPPAVTEAFDAVRECVRRSPLMQDTRPSAAQERRDFVALWADLEQAGPSLDQEAPETIPDYPVLVPGQD